MCLKHTNVVYCCVYLLCQISLFGCQVTLVKRDIIDKFRIGDQGCKGNQSVCTNVGASCHTDSGLCECNALKPHFRNPTITVKDGFYIYESSYGCLKTDVIQQRISGSACIQPFQSLSDNHSQSAAAFPNDAGNENCSLNNVEAKYPNSNIWHQVSWLNDTYVNINVVKRYLYFKFQKSVPQLQGLIIITNLRCIKITGGSEQSYSECFQGKVSGTWVVDGSPTPKTQPTTTKNTENPTEVNPQDISRSSTIMATVVSSISPTASSNNKPDQFFSTTDGSKYSISTDNPKTIVVKESTGYWKNVAIALSVILSVVIVLLMITVAFLVKEKRIKRSLEKRPTSKEKNDSKKEKSTYDYPIPLYAGLENRGRDKEESHVYQGLVGVHGNNSNQSATGGSLEMQSPDV